MALKKIVHPGNLWMPFLMAEYRPAHFTNANTEDQRHIK